MSVLKFNYKNYGPHIYRPVIPVELEYDERSVVYEVLVDSGADGCIFDAEIGEILGINVSSGEKREVRGITGGPLPYFMHEIVLKVGGWPKKTKVGFMENMPLDGYGVVGQQGFFDTFIVTFDLAKGEILLKQRLVK